MPAAYRSSIAPIIACRSVPLRLLPTVLLLEPLEWGHKGQRIWTSETLASLEECTIVFLVFKPGQGIMNPYSLVGTDRHGCILLLETLIFLVICLSPLLLVISWRSIIEILHQRRAEALRVCDGIFQQKLPEALQLWLPPSSTCPEAICADSPLSNSCIRVNYRINPHHNNVTCRIIMNPCVVGEMQVRHATYCKGIVNLEGIHFTSDGVICSMSVELSDWNCSTIFCFLNGNEYSTYLTWFDVIKFFFSGIKKQYALVLGSTPRLIASTARAVCLPFFHLSESR